MILSAILVDVVACKEDEVTAELSMQMPPRAVLVDPCLFSFRALIL